MMKQFNSPNKAVSKKRKMELMPMVKKVAPYLIGALVLIKLNKALFFISVFSYLTYMGKQLRGKLGLKMVVLDPMMFASIMCAAFLGWKEALIFIVVNTIIIDFVTNIASIGTFLNFVLYLVSSIGATLVFGSTSMMVYGNIASLAYSGLYMFFRSVGPLRDDPFQVWSKGITSFVFTYLYLLFFGPILQIVMSI